MFSKRNKYEQPNNFLIIGCDRIITLEVIKEIINMYWFWDPPWKYATQYAHTHNMERSSEA